MASANGVRFSKRDKRAILSENPALVRLIASIAVGSLKTLLEQQQEEEEVQKTKPADTPDSSAVPQLQRQTAAAENELLNFFDAKELEAFLADDNM